MREGKPWFAPKQHGFGAAFPISWEGWLTLTLFVVGVAAASSRLDGVARVAAVTVLIIGLVLIVSRKTAGGWRWRSGE